MSAENKSIVIKSNKSVTGTLYKWDRMGDFIKEFTSSIDASFSGESGGKKPNISQAVSGLPSAFARASMFAYAMKSTAADGQGSGLNAFCGMLLDEWKGLIASFVLAGSSSFKVKRVQLNYSTGDGTIATAQNIYEPKGAFGNVLFGKKQLWEDQDNIGDSQRILKPFIDIIYFNNKVVGATSPESLIFTSPGYLFPPNERQAVYIGESSGKFTDPLNSKGKITQNELSLLLAYVTKFSGKISSFYSKYEQSKHLLPEGIDQSIGKLLGIWIDQMKAYAKENNLTINEEVSPEVVCFNHEPFKSFFNVTNAFFADFEGTIFKDTDTILPEYVEFKVGNLLLDDKTTILARIEGDEESIKKCPVHLLKVQIGNGYKYFSIPLSELGLKIFQRSMVDLISGKTNSNASSLTAIYDVNNNMLNTQLELRKKDGSLITKIRANYKCHSESVGSDQLIIWPNFVSKLWNKYYLFSEMPHNNASGWQAFPILGDTEKSFPLFDKEYASKSGKTYNLPENEFGFIKIAENGKVINKELGEILVGNIETMSTYKYEIYESKKPFKGVELKYSGQSAGFVFLKFDGDASTNNIKNEIDSPKIPNPTRVGIDFGSNNTCVAYWDDEIEGGSPQLLEFTNRRVSLFSSDGDHNESNKSAAAASFEMLFFQNDEPMSNKIKSVLTIHDESRIINESGSDINLALSEVVKGGFMCYEANIAIEDSTPNRHILTVPKIKDQKVMMVHNMKWNTDKKEASYKQAFLKAILLQTYAELFEKTKSYYVNELVWAYPSSMSASAISDYSTKIWGPLKTCNPFDSGKYPINVAQGSKATTGSNASIFANDQASSGGMNQMGGGMNQMGGGMNQMGGGMNQMGGGMNQMGGGMNQMGGGMNQMGGGMNQMGGGMNQGVASNSKLLTLELPEEVEQMFNPNAFKNTIIQPAFSDDFKACTEAMAVANYAVGGDKALSAGMFSLGFDVGGSTTDILAVTSLNINGEPISTLIKQSSIKIAAGSFSEASKIAPGFKELLQNFAAQKKWNIHGIKTMSANTVPFYYNLIVDRLNTKEELDSFYLEIAANCKPMMWLNLYLTGLTIFYGGMVSRKLRATTEKNPDIFSYPLSNLTLNFYGKGARIFDWFKAIDNQNAYNYYLNCFASGYGPDAGAHFNGGAAWALGNFAQNRFTDSSSKDDNVKVEVAKGLAIKSGSSNSMGGAKRGIAEVTVKLSEIIGEDGYLLKVPGQQQPVELNALMDINPSLIQRLGSELLPPMGQNNYPRFKSFIEIFYQYASQNSEFNMDPNELLRGINSMNVLGELKTDDGYKQALNAKEFDFVAPLIILQGQAFLKNVLMPKIQKGL